MFRIAICDDEKHICSELEKTIIEYSNNFPVEIPIEVFFSGEEICNHMKLGNKFDLIFLDIELKMMNGVEVGRFIREDLRDEIVQIVYISGKDSYYLELFDIRPMHFLHKPLNPVKIIEDIEKAMELANIFSYTFTYKQGHDIYKIETKEIIYFESMLRKIKMITVEEEIYFYESLKTIYKDLMGQNFLWTHQSYLVNYAHIIRFGTNQLTMSNGDVLPISRSRSSEVMDFILEYEKRH